MNIIKDKIRKNCYSETGKLRPTFAKRSAWEAIGEESVFDSIFSETSFLPPDSSFRCRVFAIMNDIVSPPTCIADGCEVSIKWNDRAGKFPEYCSKACISRSTRDQAKSTMTEIYGTSNGKSAEVIEKTKKKMMDRYGVEHQMHRPEVVDKIKNTNLERYGHEYGLSSDMVKEKVKSTNLEKNGVENPLSSTEIQDQIKRTNLERYGHDNPSKSPEVRKKTESTCMERYGHKSPLQSPDVKDGIKQTNLERHGVENPFQSPLIKDKIKQTNLERYGFEHPVQSQLVKDKIKNTTLLKYGTSSALSVNFNKAYAREWKCDDWFRDKLKEISVSALANMVGVTITAVYKRAQSLGIEFTGSQFEENISTILCNIVKFKNDRKVISPLELDFYLPDVNLAIECNGSYYHSELRGKDRHYHLNKTKLCEAQGIQLIHIWEHDWIKNPELIKRRLLSKLGKNEKVFARKTQVAKLTTQTAAEFLNQHHLQGTCPASVKYGLYDKDELVAVMSLGKSRFSKNYEWELLRYCSTKQVIGGASKLFKHFQREYQPKSVVSYSDKMWNTGNLYKQLGFEYSHTSAPSYYYTKNYLDFENRVAYQKHKLHNKLETFDPNKSEWENMQANGFDRIWDCGSDVWVLPGE